MKKFLGIVAVALIVGAPALAQNNSTMSYTLMLGGTPSADQSATYNLAGAVETGPYTIPGAGPTYILNWAARVSVGGDIGGSAVGGAANIVFDVKVHQDTIAGPLVGPAFGIGGPAANGFYSVVQSNPAGGANGQQPAAFPWVFNADFLNGTTTPPSPYGRLFDDVANNGPAMTQYTYPSTFNYYRKIVGGVSDSTANTTTVTAASGTLMGMGAGYPDFDFFDGAPQRGGVGLPTDSGSSCYQNIGNEPIAEGQINMTGLPGTYVLELVAGTGNNVILPGIVCDPNTGGTTGAFAAAAGTVTGSSITFVVPGVVTVPPPVLQPNVASLKTQGGVVYGIPFIGDTVTTNPGGTTTLSVECRANGVTSIALPFDVAVEAPDGTIDGTEIALTGATLAGAVTQTTPGVLIVPVTTTNQNGSCVKVTVSGLRKLGSGGAGLLSAAVTKSIVALRGDVTGNGAVDASDTSAVKAGAGSALSATAVMFRRDVTANGAIDASDTSNVKALAGNGAPACP